MADCVDQVALKAWSRGRATPRQRAQVLGPLLHGEALASRAHAAGLRGNRTAETPVGQEALPGFGGLFARARGRAQASAAARSAEQVRAASVVAQFEDLASADLRAALQSIGEDDCTPSLVELLSSTGYDRRLRTPTDFLPWTEAGVELGQKLAAGERALPAVAVLARAWALHGNALRIANRYDEAELAFANSRSVRRSAPDDPSRLAELLRLEAGLASDRGRFGVAKARLARARKLCDEVGDRPGAARVVLAQAALTVAQGRPEESLDLLAEAEILLLALGDTRRALVARHNRVIALVDLGRLEEALPYLAGLRLGYDAVEDRQDLVRLAWLEGRVFAGLGRLAAAERKLTDVREVFLAEGQNLSAAFVTLDLAGILVREGRWPELAASAVAMASAFDRAGTHREAAAALELLGLAARRGAVDAGTLEDVTRTLRELESRD